MATELLRGEDNMEKFEAAAVGLLRYIEDNADGFRILVRDSNPASGSGTFASLISDIASQVEYILADVLKVRGYDPKFAPVYSQMLVGMVAFAGQWWLDVRKPKLEEMAAHLVNLAWNGLSQLDPKPKIAPGALQRLTEDPDHRRRAAPSNRAPPSPRRPHAARPALRTAAGHHEDAPEWQHGPVRRLRVFLPQHRSVLGHELRRLAGVERRQHRPQAGALIPAQDRVVAGQHVQVGRLPRVDRAALARQQVQVARWIGGLPVEGHAGQQRPPAGRTR